jgi:hypothetical protein
MTVNIKFLRSAGLTDTQILDVIEAQRSEWREQKRNYRANVQRRPKTSKDKGLFKDLPSRLEPNGSNLSGRRKSKTAFPDPWPWPIRLEDQTEFQNFKKHALENDRHSARWDMSFERWLASPYRKVNGGQHGNAHRETPIEQGKRLADEWRRREQEYGAGLFGSADNAGSARGGRQDADGLPQQPRRSA